MKERLYIAYGSNLNISQMSYRCPTAAFRGVSVLKDYRLCFKSLYGGNNAFATIEPCMGAEVPVAVWKIEPRDEYALDRYEGFPVHYYKKNLTVSLAGRKVDVMVYIMNDKASYASPSEGYFKTVLEGYQSMGLNVDYLYEALDNHDLTLRNTNPLKYYRNNIGVTQEELAELAGIPLSSLQKYESKHRELGKASVGMVVRLAEALGVEVKCLV